ncbi:unnamed protein product [Calicophoron daubneyi]|uniref:Uncharacterized protein n=1 Tax=Calicophoron daubneyi TaxID=300641 RepID=A0AAV2T474_CALDB
MKPTCDETGDFLEVQVKALLLMSEISREKHEARAGTILTLKAMRLLHSHLLQFKDEPKGCDRRVKDGCGKTVRFANCKLKGSAERLLLKLWLQARLQLSFCQLAEVDTTGIVKNIDTSVMAEEPEAEMNLQVGIQECEAADLEELRAQFYVQMSKVQARKGSSVDRESEYLDMATKYYESTERTQNLDEIQLYVSLRKVDLCLLNGCQRCIPSEGWRKILKDCLYMLLTKRQLLVKEIPARYRRIQNSCYQGGEQTRNTAYADSIAWWRPNSFLWTGLVQLQLRIALCSARLAAHSQTIPGATRALQTVSMVEKFDYNEPHSPIELYQQAWNILNDTETLHRSLSSSSPYVLSEITLAKGRVASALYAFGIGRHERASEALLYSAGLCAFVTGDGRQQHRALSALLQLYQIMLLREASTSTADSVLKKTAAQLRASVQQNQQLARIRGTQRTRGNVAALPGLAAEFSSLREPYPSQSDLTQAVSQRLWRLHSCTVSFLERLKQTFATNTQLIDESATKNASSFEGTSSRLVHPPDLGNRPRLSQFATAHCYDLAGKLCLGAKKHVYENEIQKELETMTKSSVDTLVYNPVENTKMVRNLCEKSFSPEEVSTKSPVIWTPRRQKGTEEATSSFAQLVSYRSLLERICMNYSAGAHNSQDDSGPPIEQDWSTEKELTLGFTENTTAAVGKLPLIQPFPYYTQDVNYWGQRFTSLNVFLLNTYTTTSASLIGGLLNNELDVTPIVLKSKPGNEGETKPDFRLLDEDESGNRTVCGYEPILQYKSSPDLTSQKKLHSGTKNLGMTQAFRPGQMLVQVLDCFDDNNDHAGPVLILLNYHFKQSKRIRNQTTRVESRLALIPQRHLFYQLVSRMNALQSDVLIRGLEDHELSDTGQKPTKNRIPGSRGEGKAHTVEQSDEANSQLETEFAVWLNEFCELLKNAQVFTSKKREDNEVEIEILSTSNTVEALDPSMQTFTNIRRLFARNQFGGLIPKGNVQDYFLTVFNYDVPTEKVESMRT